jgi:hypothetical protein
MMSVALKIMTIPRIRRIGGSDSDDEAINNDWGCVDNDEEKIS